MKGWKKIFRESENGKKKAWVVILISDKIGFKTKTITRDKEKPSNFISAYLSKDSHVHPYVHCSITYNKQDIEATWVSING